MLNHADRHHRQLFDLPAHRLPSRDTLPHGEHVAATAALRPILKNLIDRGERQQIPTVPLMATLSTTPTPGETLLPPPRRRARRIGARWLRAVARTAPQAPLQLRDPLILPGNPISQRLDLRIHTQGHLNDRLPAQRHRPPPPQHTPHRDIRHHQAMPPRPTKRLQKTPPEQGFSATRQERFELPTFGSVDRRSIQLSYWRRTTQFSEHAPAPRLRMRSRGRAPDPRAPQARLRRGLCGGRFGGTRGGGGGGARMYMRMLTTIVQSRKAISAKTLVGGASVAMPITIATQPSHRSSGAPRRMARPLQTSTSAPSPANRSDRRRRAR
jgi:hypothetical protein